MKMEYLRFLREIIEMPCQLLHTGRRRVYRLLDVNGLEPSSLGRQCVAENDERLPDRRSKSAKGRESWGEVCLKTSTEGVE